MFIQLDVKNALLSNINKKYLLHTRVLTKVENEISPFRVSHVYHKSNEKKTYVNCNNNRTKTGCID